MNKESQSIVVVLLGGLILSITASGRFTAYVKPGFAPLLWIAGIVLVLVGILSLVQMVLTDRRRSREETVGTHAHAHEATVDGEDHGHDHDRSRAPWLILAPVLVLLVMAPPALGADSLERNSGSQALAGMEPPAAEVDTSNTRNDGSGALPGAGAGQVTRDASGKAIMEFGPLPEGADPQITLKEFILRALYDPENSVTQTPVTVVGFVGPSGEGFTAGWTLARLSIACCAADASAIRLHVDGSEPYPTDTWVRAVVTAVPGTADRANEYVPTVQVQSLTVIEQPADPYE